jgi:hypothetical protein
LDCDEGKLGRSEQVIKSPIALIAHFPQPTRLEPSAPTFGGTLLSSLCQIGICLLAILRSCTCVDDRTLVPLHCLVPVIKEQSCARFPRASHTAPPTVRVQCNMLGQEIHPLKLQPNPLVPSPALTCHWSPTAGPPEMLTRGWKGRGWRGEPPGRNPTRSRRAAKGGSPTLACAVGGAVRTYVRTVPAVGYSTVTATDEWRGELRQDTAVAAAFRGRDQLLAVPPPCGSPVGARVLSNIRPRLRLPSAVLYSGLQDVCLTRVGDPDRAI